MIIISFDKRVPEQLRPQIEKHLNEFARYMPLWVRQVSVYWNSDGAEHNASVDTLYRYRHAGITLRPEFLDQTLEAQRHIILHEVCHFYNGPIGDVAHEILAMMCPKGDEAESVESQHVFQVLSQKISDIVEEINSDLTYMLDKLQDELVIDPGPPSVPPQTNVTHPKAGFVNPKPVQEFGKKRTLTVV